MDVAVIIPTHNRTAYLLELLAALENQTLNPTRFQVVVVDNGSDGECRRAAAALKGCTPFRFSYLHEPVPGLHNARHAGMRAAECDLLVFADDDIIPFDTWLEAICEAFAKPDVRLVGGKNLPLWETPPPRWLERMWSRQKGDRILGELSILDLGELGRDIDASLVWGCNFAVSRTLLQEAGGFHPDGMPWELIHLRGDGETHVSNYMSEKGYRAFYHPEASVRHRVPKERMTLAYFKKRAYSQGISDSFRDLRISRGVLAAAGSSPKPGEIPRLWEAVRKALGVGGGLSDRARVEKETAAAYRKGYGFHQALFTKDEKIREWVLKTDYL
ncbi:glycosyltransferase [Geomonas agri]|uniref:glycosyltransferase n=1 Tax=Geomonas agri TaxID=2873702 RepID=UPI001CD1DD8E|nr:glycosyltransferase family 2 protein [Geomonas agri]